MQMHSLQSSSSACRQQPFRCLLAAAARAAALSGLCQAGSRRTLVKPSAAQRQQQQQELEQRVQHRASPAVCAAVSAAGPVQTEGRLLDTLSYEQQAAALAPEQHVRVIAGPGSGKTRVVAARVSWALQQGEAPKSMLVITFTRKAAGELQDRLRADTGSMPRGLTACTFHYFCADILRKYADYIGTSGWSVADQDDTKSIITTILSSNQQPEPQQAALSTPEQHGDSSKQSDAEELDGAVLSKTPSSRSRSRSRSTAMGTSSGSSSSSSRTSSTTSTAAKDKQPQDKVEARTVRYFSNQISVMKNFVESTHSEGRLKQGIDIIQELRAAKVGSYAELADEKVLQLASVFDSYQRQLRWRRLWDYDDLLHHCLALLHNNPQVRKDVHNRWRHILVDEGQDTNLCQFELIRQITGADSKLFMVGDPDQAIYGFRGARSTMLQDRFDALYGSTATTYHLSDNYRSRPAIVTVADSIRRNLRPNSHVLVAGRSLRPYRDEVVTLLAAQDLYAEARHISQQLQDWHKQGYSWGDMAVLCRAKRPIKAAYLRAIEDGIPAHLQVGDFWESIEVKTAVALLRAVAYPEAASEVIRRRLVLASTEVKVPVTAGLGKTAIDRLATTIQAANDRREAAGSSSSGSAGSVADSMPTSLGGCLLAGCALGSLSQQQAEAVWQQWQDAVSSGGKRADALRGLAPAWQLPPVMGLVASKAQQAGIDRLRGLVFLGTAAATLGLPPHQVLQLLLQESGIVSALQDKVADGAPDKAAKASNRLKSLYTLLMLAYKGSAAEGEFEHDSVVELHEDDDDVWPEDDFHRSSYAPGSHRADSTAKLRAFVESCSLQGDSDEEGGATQRGPSVNFLTIHGSKGKEFGCVVAMSFYEGVLPSDQAGTPEALEQERNTAYVAVTRAKDQLLITWPSTERGRRGELETNQVSSFLRETMHLAASGQLSGVKVVKVRSKLH